MSDPPPPPGPSAAPATGLYEFVTVTLDGQLFGLPIGRVQDVFVVGELTPVPLAPAEVAGLVNLRGRIVTAIDLRGRLGLPPKPSPDGGRPDRIMAVGIEGEDDHYGLIVDEIGEVIRLGPETRAENPVQLGGRWAQVACGVHRLDGRILVALDVDAVLSCPVTAPAA